MNPTASSGEKKGKGGIAGPGGKVDRRSGQLSPAAHVGKGMKSDLHPRRGTHRSLFPPSQPCEEEREKRRKNLPGPLPGIEGKKTTPSPYSLVAPTEKEGKKESEFEALGKGK